MCGKLLTAIFVLALVVLPSLVASTREAHAVPSCPSGNQVDLVIAPNGNALLVCAPAVGGFDWYIYDADDHLLYSTGHSGYSAVLNISVSPDSKFIIFFAATIGGVDWEIYGSNGSLLTSTGDSIYSSVSGVISTNDSKFAFVLRHATGVDWEIYGANGQYLNGSGATNATLLSLGGTLDNKVVIRICYTNTNQAETYTYAANGTLESVNPAGPCSSSVGSVGGIAEYPDVAQGLADSPAAPSDDPLVPTYALLAALAAVVGLTLTAGAWHARRRPLG